MFKDKFSVVLLWIALSCMFVGFLGVGCVTNGTSAVQQKYATVDGCENSLILKSVRHPDQVKSLIFLANAMVINKGLFSCTQVLETLDSIEALVKPDTSYLSFVTAITPIVDKLNGSAGFVLIAVSPILGQFYFDIPINECDRQILLTLVGDIRTYVLALSPEFPEGA